MRTSRLVRNVIVRSSMSFCWMHMRWFSCSRRRYFRALHRRTIHYTYNKRARSCTWHEKWKSSGDYLNFDRGHFFLLLLPCPGRGGNNCFLALIQCGRYQCADRLGQHGDVVWWAGKRGQWRSLHWRRASRGNARYRLEAYRWWFRWVLNDQNRLN